jgi:PAS domain S-box-containing protein
MEVTYNNSIAFHLLNKFQADREKMHRYMAVAERCPLPAFITGSDGISIVYINPAYRELTGRTLDELQDGKWPIVIHPEDRASAMEVWRVFIQTDKKISHWHRYQHRDGSSTLALTLVDRVDDNGFVGFILPQCGTDDCPIRRLNQEMFQACGHPFTPRR